MDEPADKIIQVPNPGAAGFVGTTTTSSSTNFISTSEPDAETRAWHIISYEVWMYFGTRSTTLVLSDSEIILKNAMVESAIVHARILCDIFSSKSSTIGVGIRLKDRFPDWNSDSVRLRNLKSKANALRERYGYSGTEGSPYKVFHERALHADQTRYLSFQRYDYVDQFKILDPLIRAVVYEIEAIRGPLYAPPL
jgi:hypothetical protein